MLTKFPFFCFPSLLSHPGNKICKYNSADFCRSAYMDVRALSLSIIPCHFSHILEKCRRGHNNHFRGTVTPLPPLDDGNAHLVDSEKVLHAVDVFHTCPSCCRGCDFVASFIHLRYFFVSLYYPLPSTCVHLFPVLFICIIGCI